ncbi:MAG: permease prefix domain 1-containing protein [Candidatus Hydrogenedentes bacterium]|nr:permease prefix domain 1-containing protein [Candidatus Hydrogenedentota bacterium]
MKALRIHVERIVRPIRGGVLRKNKMREELLGHLMTAYAEEVKSAPSEKEAIARATQRLGDPAALRAELQATVPVWERLGHLPIPVLAPEIDDFEGQSHVSFATRFTAIVLSWLVVGAPVLVSIGFLVYYTVGRAVVRPRPFNLHGAISALPCIAGMIALLGVALFVTLMLFSWIGGRKVVSRTSREPSFVKASLITGLWLAAVGLFLAMAVPFGNFLNRGTSQIPPSEVFAAIGTAMGPSVYLWLLFPLAMLVFTTPMMTFERRQYENWGSLDIDSEDEEGTAKPA